MSFDLHHFLGDGHLVHNVHDGFDQYDAMGHKVGFSMATPDGGHDHFDALGAKLGHVAPDMSGRGVTEYDRLGHVVGRSEVGFTGDVVHRDALGHTTHDARARMDGGHDVYNASGAHLGSVGAEHFGRIDVHGDPLAAGQNWTFPRFGG